MKISFQDLYSFCLWIQICNLYLYQKYIKSIFYCLWLEVLAQMALGCSRFTGQVSKRRFWVSSSLIKKVSKWGLWLWITNRYRSLVECFYLLVKSILAYPEKKIKKNNAIYNGNPIGFKTPMPRFKIFTWFIFVISTWK